ncbi:MAG: hypothetical protein A2Z62_00535 [Candidatus Terrybacteria bacterium RIFCSPLOWO2_02_42_20]|uniref:Transcriptional repressor PaaX-like central Cas2-like domain-containing protein n=1 Tax=Candidatus Terrybacteria bacterium RIFCSPLOWO2_02_42_20 TaxID=1802370 RepID=A0A1G2Q1S5_9BACT|nr:MAG: hypothetical protein A2Z62_00535 [Candidatus Terrybacteria bacterium RIFCSPLOWO2_02_42_20]
MIKRIKAKSKIKSIRDPYKKGELAKEILMGLIKGGIIVSSFALPNMPLVLKMFKANDYRDRYRITRIMKKLKNKKLLDIYEKEGKERIEITEKGKKRIVRYQIDELKLNRPKKWDGQWRIIMFDIPEKFKKGRDALAKKMKDMEIYPMQKSVYVCPFHCKDEIDFVSEVFGVRKFVHYVIAGDLGESEELKLKMFYKLE